MLICLAVVGLSVTFWSPAIAQAAEDTIWESCPRGMVDCAYPGRCSSYIDTNNDNICDRSQPEPQVDEATPTLNTSTVEDTTDTPAVMQDVASTDSSASDESAAVNASTGRRSFYNFVPLLATFAALYAVTWVLAKKNVIRLQLHRKIWNVVLMVSAVISAILGVILILNLDFGTNIFLPFNMLFWHVEAGIVMSIIAAFHIAWHYKYFLKILK